MFFLWVFFHTRLLSIDVHKISSLMFLWRKKFMLVLNNMRVSKWCKNVECVVLFYIMTINSCWSLDTISSAHCEGWVSLRWDFMKVWAISTPASSLEPFYLLFTWYIKNVKNTYCQQKSLVHLYKTLDFLILLINKTTNCHTIPQLWTSIRHDSSAEKVKHGKLYQNQGF